MTFWDHVFEFFYIYWPRFVTEEFECRKDNPDGTEANWGEPLGPEDMILRLTFFNLFGKAIFSKVTMIKPTL